MRNDFIDGLDFRYILLDKYKQMKITEEELVVILMIDHLINQGNPFVTPDLLALKMNYSQEEIDRILASLMQKDIFKYLDKEGKITTSLDPLYKRLSNQFKKDLVVSNMEETEDNKDLLKKLYEIFQAAFGRNLTPLEIQRIHEWVQVEYTEEDIIDALEEATKGKYFSIKAVDRILLRKTKQRDLKKEGYTAATDANRIRINEVLDLAKKEKEEN